VPLPRAKLPEPAPVSARRDGTAPLDVPAQPADAKAEEAGAAASVAEESLAPVPMQRGYVVPVVVALTVLGLAGGAAYMYQDGGALGDSAPTDTHDNAAEAPGDGAAPPRDTDGGRDASVAVPEASVVATTPKPKPLPARPTPRPADRAKQAKHPAKH
jgi:hypothetical protein